MTEEFLEIADSFLHGRLVDLKMIEALKKEEREIIKDVIDMYSISANSAISFLRQKIKGCTIH